MSLLLKRKPPPWRKWLSLTLDLLYPPECNLCGVGLTGGSALCLDCESTLPRVVDPFCKKCGEPFGGRIDGEFACPNCSSLKFAFEFARPAMAHDARTVDLIHRLKYSRELYTAIDLGRLAWKSFEDPRLADSLKAHWPLIPVPLHRGRFQQRHFNQAEEISNHLSDLSGLPIVKALHRVRPTEHQTILTRSQRMENLRGAFVLSKAGRVEVERSPAGAVLVDDVLTTGSTVNECAKVLRKAGFQRVAVVTVMRG